MSIFVKPRRDGFCRCGVRHPGEGREYPDDFFTEEQIGIMSEDPDILVVAGCFNSEELKVGFPSSEHQDTLDGGDVEADEAPEEPEPEDPKTTVAPEELPAEAEPEETPAPDPGPTMEELTAAAQKAIEDGNTIKSGAPSVPAMEEILGRNITPEQRNQAWASFQQENA